MKLDKLIKWIPIVGIYFIKNSNDSIWKKLYWIFGNILFSIFFVGLLAPSGNKTIKNTTTEKLPQRELKSETETKNAAFVEAVKRIGNGTGKEWNSATEQERVAACFVMSKALLKRVNQRHAARLYQELDAFYKDKRMESQEVATTATILSRMIQE
ncbi:hypothetical protein [Leptospira interrogans]|uniref:Uncharacterized protein n=1 Tax=Leptospira interrogans TaxID=173 RepID=A0AAV9FQJ0_LEPIR|nr:hypothetical protein [Leptospira interrogans]EKO89106.1 hypothetical protein LEP1GSC009_4142 [Leptospira interrogans serovar Grippotyphosa str. Andaman]EKP83574.1 hypothetical protein LEP1GSC020_3179 [Leptospira interrogans serovar Grippotyphosa str. 2006006986]EMN79764.1 hypothetical protein LEP1GSC106_3459 [Leptospira interrogans serovar Grippotyphosa str. UI 12764]EMO00844.1 hypothetical protein LEP1GSC112_0233 [Leptospira interrogans serovar Pomona str. UT364]EMO94383.1 hypothetical pro